MIWLFVRLGLKNCITPRESIIRCDVIVTTLEEVKCVLLSFTFPQDETEHKCQKFYRHSPTFYDMWSLSRTFLFHVWNNSKR